MTAPPILKIRFVPGGKTARRNRTYANYIARNKASGVVIEDTAEASTGESHLRYLAERPKSHGLFNDVDDHPALDQAMRDAAGRGGPSWRLVVSLRDEDAAELGLTSLKHWRDFTRRYAPQFARVLGYSPDQVTWWAAHHRPPGKGRHGDPTERPHVHIMMLLNDGVPARRGELTDPELRDARRALAAEMFGPTRQRQGVERTAARDALVALSRAAVAEHGVLPTKQARHLDELLKQLADGMPGHGRAALRYLPPDATAKAREVADWLLSQDVAQPDLQRYEEATRNLASMYRLSSNTDEAWGNARRDLRDRMAQAAVREAVRLHRDERSDSEKHRRPQSAPEGGAGARSQRSESQRRAERLAAQTGHMITRHAERAERAAARGQARAVAEAEARVQAERLAQQGLER